MLFSCLPSECKCEHVFLRNLISEYNQLHDGAYTRFSRPDVEQRNEMAPDLLLKGNGVPSVAIERKCVIWPVNSHVIDHRHCHHLLSYVKEGVCSRDESFGNGLYQLRFWERSIKGLRDGEVREIGQRIAEVVLENRALAKTPKGVTGDEPIGWWFGLLPSWERDESMPDLGFGLSVLCDGPPGLTRQAETLDGLSGEFRRLMADIDQKFSRYDNHRRLVALQFFGDPWMPFEEEDVRQMIDFGELPNSVDEVWLAYHDWVSPDDYRIGWKPIWG